MTTSLLMGRATDGIHHGHRLVDRLLVFARWIGVGHDARAGLQISPAVFQDNRAQRDATIQRPVEPEIADGAGVTTALIRLELVDDLHRPDLWSAGDRAGR